MKVIELLEQIESKVNATWAANEIPSTTLLSNRYRAWMKHTPEIIAVLKEARAFANGKCRKCRSAVNLVNAVDALDVEEAKP